MNNIKKGDIGLYTGYGFFRPYERIVVEVNDKSPVPFRCRCLTHDNNTQHFDVLHQYWILESDFIPVHFTQKK
ncbi:MAG: hypothetical protein BV459_00605 [Thermoplasmata archaeon M11B2D]|nr:MAG: hypothetical protein BV459_00605 [Thermoplasmata archaeon M11B2D]